MSDNVPLVQNCQTRMEAMRGYRLSWWAHWAMLAEVFLPRRYRWFITPNQYNRGSPKNQAIIDETGMLAARICATGMLAGLTSPTKPWFRLGVHGRPDLQSSAARDWLEATASRMALVLSESNFYQALGVTYHDLAVFGSAPIICYEDFDDVVRFYNPELGSFFFASSKRLDIDTLYREYTYTVRETVDEFGIENVSESTRQAYRTGGASLETEVVIGHAIEPNVEVWQADKNNGLPVPKIFPYREVFWEQTTSANQTRSGSPLRVKGFREKPFVGARWDVTSNDPYGRSPGMDALPAVNQLQVEQRRKGEAIDKMVRPPMVASVAMKNEPLSILPGGVSYVADVQNQGFKPAFQVDPRIAEMVQDITEIQNRIKSIFFVDLFMMISSLPQQTERTATEIDARREEKLIQLGPVIERFENEVLTPLITRVFNIMQRRGLIDPPPPELSGAAINITYVSMLAEAQSAASTAAIERVLALAGNLAGVDPSVMDNIDIDETIEIYADKLKAPAKMIRDEKQMAVLRQERARQQQAAEAVQTGTALAQGAKTLSDTEVGGGKNALETMLGGAA